MAGGTSILHAAGILTVLGAVGVVCGGLTLVTPTVGYPWPRPQMTETQETYMVIRPETFKFSTVGHDCDILQEALKRYTSIMFPASRVLKNQPWRKDHGFSGYLDSMKVNLLTPCEDYPHHEMDEHYEIKIDSPDAPGEGTIISQSIWGLLRGLETFSQLLVPDASAYNVNSTQISDFPRFAFRGLMLDTSRHYLPVDKIKDTLDLMAMNKFNVFHWHIVDDPSFPYVSAVFPDLSKFGAFSPKHVYTAEDVAAVVEYGRLRGIRVLPEFDTPGHTQSWGPGQPGLLTPCYKGSTPDGTFGPIDPTNEDNYDFLKTLFTEITGRFSDHYVHLGGDEVSFSCWESNPNITDFMDKNNITGDYSKLEQIYITKLVDIVANLPTKNGYLVWQEVFDNGVEIADDTIVHVWKNENVPAAWKHELDQVTAAGYHTVLSSCWYLNYISYGVDWYKYYECDPQDFDGDDNLTAAMSRTSTTVPRHGSNSPRASLSPRASSKSPSGSREELCQPQVLDLNNGTYEVAFTVHTEGTYSLEVLLYGQPVNGSPFTITATAPLEEDSGSSQRSLPPHTY